MRVRHPKFGEGRAKAGEGMDEDQKAKVLFETVGTKRLKVCQVYLEVLEWVREPSDLFGLNYNPVFRTINPPESWFLSFPSVWNLPRNPERHERRAT